MSLLPYFGEFLVSPVPLELSLGSCDHLCRYCFANLGKPPWRANMASVLNLLAERNRRDTLEAHLLRAGYPVVISNRSDPFSRSRHRQSLAIIETLAAMGVPVAIQTKGGPGAEDACDLLPPSVWYVTVTTLDADLAGRIEPGAPRPAERLALIERLRAKGHRVVHGMNPCVPEWSPDPGALLAATHAAGAEGAWIERLHLNANQEKALTAAARDALTEPLVRAARKRYIEPSHFEHLLRARDEAKALGMQVFSGGQPTPSEFWRPYRECYQKTFPTTQDFLNGLHAEPATGSPRLVTFAEWSGYFLDRLPDVEGARGGQHYVACLVGLCRKHEWPYTNGYIRAGMGWADILATFWEEPRLSACPANLPNFALAAQGGELLRDDSGLPVLVFCRDGTSEMVIEV